MLGNYLHANVYVRWGRRRASFQEVRDNVGEEIVWRRTFCEFRVMSTVFQGKYGYRTGRELFVGEVYVMFSVI